MPKQLTKTLEILMSPPTYSDKDLFHSQETNQS